MSERQSISTESTESISVKVSTLSNFIRRNLDGEFAEVFALGNEPEPLSAEDTIVLKGKTLGNLIAERTIRPESKDLALTFMPKDDTNLTAETVRFRIPKYRGESPYYEYSKVLKSGEIPKPLRNTKEAEAEIKAFGKKIGHMLGIRQDSV